MLYAVNVCPSTKDVIHADFVQIETTRQVDPSSRTQARLNYCPACGRCDGYVRLRNPKESELVDKDPTVCRFRRRQW